MAAFLGYETITSELQIVIKSEAPPVRRHGRQLRALVRTILVTSSGRAPAFKNRAPSYATANCEQLAHAGGGIHPLDQTRHRQSRDGGEESARAGLVPGSPCVEMVLGWPRRAKADVDMGLAHDNLARFDVAELSCRWRLVEALAPVTTTMDKMGRPIETLLRPRRCRPMDNHGGTKGRLGS